MKKEINDNEEIFNIVNELGEEDKTVEKVKKDYPNKIIEIEEPLLICMSEKDLKILKTEFPDEKRKYLIEKLSSPYEKFYCIDDYQKPVDNF